MVYQENRYVRMGSAQLADTGSEPRLYLVYDATHIRETIENVEFCINLIDQVVHFRLHAAIARESQIDNGVFHLSVNNVGPCHTRTRGTGSMSDGCSIDNDRPFLGRRMELEA